MTVNGPPPVPPAVKSPLPSIVPPPLAVQVNAGCEPMGSPNWSLSVAANACVAFGSTVADVGLTVTLLACCCTGTTTWLVTVRPSWSVTLTRTV